MKGSHPGEPALAARLETESGETTLLVVIYHRTTRQGFGISFGDSSFTILGPDRTGEPLNPHDDRYVTTTTNQATMLDGNPGGQDNVAAITAAA